MTALRRLSIAALLLAFAQIVFGAIVRITGSGWGCGEHWPKCNGQWIPPMDHPELVIEVMHRYIAIALVVTAGALAVAAFRRRAEPGVGGAGGMLRALALAAAVVVGIALLGAVTIKSQLNPLVVVAHLALAMTLLAVLVIAVLRGGGFGAGSVAHATT